MLLGPEGKQNKLLMLRIKRFKYLKFFPHTQYTNKEQSWQNPFCLLSRILIFFFDKIRSHRYLQVSEYTRVLESKLQKNNDLVFLNLSKVLSYVNQTFSIFPCNDIKQASLKSVHKNIEICPPINKNKCDGIHTWTWVQHALVWPRLKSCLKPVRNTYRVTGFNYAIQHH